MVKTEEAHKDCFPRTEFIMAISSYRSRPYLLIPKGSPSDIQNNLVRVGAID